MKRLGGLVKILLVNLGFENGEGHCNLSLLKFELVRDLIFIT